jgi:aminoglycoside phosphotransferase (APT) family kinase protein
MTGYAIGPRLVERILELNELQDDVAAPVNPQSWGAFMQHSLLDGEIGWAMHEPLRLHSTRARRLLERIERIGADVQPWRFKADGISHLDLHTGNLLLTGDDHLSGVVDWEGACDGDHRFDLVTFAHNLETLGHHALVEPVWKHVEATLEPDTLRAYVAHMVLRLVDWQIRNDPGDVEHQMDIGEALLNVYA